MGYSKAARIIDQLELGELVGPNEGNKPRQALVAKNAVDPDSI